MIVERKGKDLQDVKVLIFDLDYTLLDSSDGIVESFNQARLQAGEPEVEPATLKARIGLPIEETFRLFDSADPSAMRESFRKLARDGLLAKYSFLLPGVAQILPKLKNRGYRLAVASTKSRLEIIAVLEALGVKHYFEQFCGSDEVPSPKPAPDSLLLVMQRMEADPLETVYVGDHVVDIQAARAAEIRIIAIEGGPCEPESLVREKPDTLIGSFEQILTIL